MSNQTSTAVAAFYNRYPFPFDREITEELYLLDLINFWGGTTPACELKPNLRVLIAGCGTNQALSFACSLPKAEIVAIDLSETSLGISKKRADRMGIHNIRFLQADILNLPDLGKYDFISSYGVLHHLANPELGLKNLVQHLNPDGILELMLYSETHRYMIARMQRVFKLLSGLQASPEQHFKVAQEFIRSATPQSWPFGIYIDQAGIRNLAETNQPAFTDTYLHPCETSYNYESLHRFLARADLKIVNFLNPDEWDTDLDIFGNSFLESCFLKQDLASRHELIDLLNGPIYAFYARRNETACEIPNLNSSDVLNYFPLMNHIRYHRFDDQHQVVESREADLQIATNPKQDAFVDVQFYTHKMTDNRLIRDIIPLCLGNVSGQQIGTQLAQKFRVTNEQILPILQHVLKRLYQCKILVAKKTPLAAGS